ncbi:MAG: 3-keto-disaccharide hydrolase [Jejuia sp.]
MFNGKNFNGWYSARNSKVNSYGVFSVNEDLNAINAYVKEEEGSKQNTDLLYTDVAYSSYILKTQYKWGKKRFAPRANFDRDAGLLFHIGEAIVKGWNGWPDSFEMQIGETEGSATKKDRCHTGDAWIIGLNNTAEIQSTTNFYSPNAAVQLFGKDKRFHGCWTSFGKEKPVGEWNDILIKVEGGKKAYFFLNGEKVMELSNMQTKLNGSDVVVNSGRIGLQAEWAEVYYRNILIKEIPAP